MNTFGPFFGLLVSTTRYIVVGSISGSANNFTTRILLALGIGICASIIGSCG